MPNPSHRADGAGLDTFAYRNPHRDEGLRVLGPFYAPLRWGMSMREYLDSADDEVLAIGVIEHIDAVESAAEIFSTPGSI